MINRYTYQDPIFRDNTLYPNLKIENGSSILKIFRLTSGSIFCKDEYTSKTYKFKKNYLSFPFDDNANLSSKTIIECFPKEVGIKDLEFYFKKAKHNEKFYKSIEIELLKCLIAEKEKRELEAFFYLYRILEGITYAIPLMYVSKNKEFNKTFNDLKSFFGKEKDGELPFFKRFISQTFKDEDFYKSNIEINLQEISVEEVRLKYHEIYISKLNDKMIINHNGSDYIKIKFLGLYELVIELRNRFFHNSKGSWQENLQSTDLLYPDLFFKPLIHHGINWVSIIIFEIIKADFEKV